MDYSCFDDVLAVKWMVGIVILSVTLSISVRFSHDVETGIDPPNGARYKPFPGIHYALWTLILLLVFSVVSVTDTWNMLFPVLLFVCLYDCLLLMFLPLLRRFFSARICGWLWALPCMPLFFYVTTNWMDAPLFVIPVPFSTVSEPKILLTVWITGCLLILLWRIISHFIVKRNLLKHSYPVTDEKILQVWKKEQKLANLKEISLIPRISPRTQTPLSIGLSRWTTYVILPEKEYTPEGLSLIFRHELIHICRQDSLNKFFMLFLTALFWFNPFMWIAMRCSADDMELSCDETVLIGCDQQTRKKYAELLLNTAADQRGFTTCLSASARALRYRLKNAIVSRKRWKGSILMGVLFAFLCVGILFGDFSYAPGTAAEKIFLKQDPTVYDCTDAVRYEEETSVDCPNTDTEALMEYLFALPVARLMRNYDDMGLKNGAQIILENQEDKYVLWLSDRYLRVRTYPNGEAVENCYILQQNVDWEYLTGVLQPT